MSNSNTTYELKNKTDLIEVKETNRVVIIFTLLTIGILTSLLFNLILVVTNYRLATRDKIYVEQIDGKTTVAQEKDPNFRSTKSIHNHVATWIYLNWEWDSNISGSDEPDSGFSLKNGQKVPSRVYAASYLLDDGFREEFLVQMSELIPRSFYSGKLKSDVRIHNLGKPVRIAQDKYKIAVIASRIDRTDKGDLGGVEFNKTLILKTIEPYQLILGSQEPSPFRKQLNELLKNGLLIESIE